MEIGTILKMMVLYQLVLWMLEIVLNTMIILVKDYRGLSKLIKLLIIRIIMGWLIRQVGMVFLIIVKEMIVGLGQSMEIIRLRVVVVFRQRLLWLSIHLREQIIHLLIWEIYYIVQVSIMCVKLVQVEILGILFQITLD